MGSIFLVNCICHEPTILCVTILLYCGTKCTFLALCHSLCLLGMLVNRGGGGGCQNNKITQCIICYCGVHLPIFLV